MSIARLENKKSVIAFTESQSDRAALLSDSAQIKQLNNCRTLGRTAICMKFIVLEGVCLGSSASCSGLAQSSGAKVRGEEREGRLRSLTVCVPPPSAQYYRDPFEPLSLALQKFGIASFLLFSITSESLCQQGPLVKHMAGMGCHASPKRTIAGYAVGCKVFIFKFHEYFFFLNKTAPRT